jgi:hypothetical protein
MGYGLEGLAGARNFSFLYFIQAGSRPHPMGTRGILPRVQRQSREADHSPPSSAGVMNCGALPLLPHGGT